jgi:formylglycine-generating enzyme required for sulfatase activity
MAHKTSSLGVAFEKALRAYEIGSIGFDDLLTQVDAQMVAGASASELLEILWRREQVEPLPMHEHVELLARIRQAQQHPTPAPPSAPPPLDTGAYRQLATEQLPPLGVAPKSVAAPVPPPAVVEAVPAAPVDEIYGEAITVVLGETPRAIPTTVGEVEPGAVFAGRFRVAEQIARGGMSRVYKALDVSLPEAERQALAVKVFTRPFDQGDSEFSALQAHFAVLRALAHPNMVQLFECGRDILTVFIVMEYLSGESLYARLRRGAGGVAAPLDRDEAQGIIAAIAGALDYAHARHVVHGDLKPANVILTASGEVKVIDFGMSGWIPRQDGHSIAVTPRYASPQLMARQTPAVEDDVYALACLAYELLSGHHPFIDDMGARTARFPPPQRPQFSTSQYAALIGGLNFDRTGRTRTVQQFMREFAVQSPQPKPRPKWWWPGVAAAAVLIAALGWWLLRDTTPGGLPPVAVAPPVTVPEEPAAVVPPAAVAPTAPRTLRDCPTCPQLAVIPAGQFHQGANDEDRNASTFERPEHLVTLGHPFAMSVDTVTVGEFQAFVTASGRQLRGCDVYDGSWHRSAAANWKEPGFTQSERHPVTCVSWNDAVAYADWISAKAGQRYRLPSAAEWEYAARAGHGSVPWDAGGANACANANVADQSAVERFPGWATFACTDGYVYTAPVGSFVANSFGLHDMLGNVMQWTQDCWHPDYTGVPADGAARTEHGCKDHELRGGSWFSAPNVVRASYRNHFAAGYRTSSVGFRLVRDVQP